MSQINAVRIYVNGSLSEKAEDFDSNQPIIITLDSGRITVDIGHTAKTYKIEDVSHIELFKMEGNDHE